MISINGIELKDLIVEAPYAFTGVESEVERSLGGNPVVFERSVSGKAFDLVGTENHGILTRSTLDQLMDIASQSRATFIFDDGTGNLSTVRFRNEEPPVITAEPIKRTQAPTPDDPFNNIRIKLMQL